MKYILIIAVFIFGIQTSVISQRGNNGKIEHLKTELGLSDTQAEELKNIFEGLRNDSEETSREEKKKAMDEGIAQVLTEEQLVKFDELKPNGRRSFGKRGKGGKKGKGMRKGISKDEETVNRLREMRIELDESISEEDKIVIDELRQAFAERKEGVKDKRESYKDLTDEEKKELREERKAKREAYKELSEEEKNEIKEERKANKEAVKADIKKLKDIAETYETEITDLFEENKAFFDEKKAERKEEWKEKKQEWKEKKEEWKEKKEEGKDGRRNSRDNRMERNHSKADHGKPRGGHLDKEAKFLLMDPDALQENAKEVIEEFNTISISPNPASILTNVTYEVKNAGQVRVEIRDEAGRIYDVIVNETLEAGTYTKSIETSKYQDKTYYISITDSKSIKTEKLLIQK